MSISRGHCIAKDPCAGDVRVEIAKDNALEGGFTTRTVWVGAYLHHLSGVSSVWGCEGGPSGGKRVHSQLTALSATYM